MVENSKPETGSPTPGPVAPASPPAPVASPPVKAKAKKRKDDLASFEAAKEALANRLWKKIPRRFRWAALVTILAGLGLGGTYSTWWPVVDAWIHPPAQHLPLGVEVYLAKGRAAADREIALLNRKDEVVARTTTDANGFATFNITDQDGIVAVRCPAADGTLLRFTVDARVLEAGQLLRITLDEKRIEYGK